MKDHATFLRAAASLEAPCRFLCLGGGSQEYAAEMRALADELGVASRVIWSPPRGDMPEVFNALDALVSSSAFGEGFSNVTGEAMACGTPCIVTDVGDSAWLVDDTGFTAPPRDSAALASAMRRFLGLDATRREHLTARARQRIVDHFTVPTMVGRTASLLCPSAEPAPARLLFIITALGTGGAEMMLAQLITGLDARRFSASVISLTEGGKHAAILQNAGVPVRTLGMVAGKPTARAIRRLRSLTRETDPNLIVGWMYHGNLAATLASWMGRRVPVLWNVRQSLYSLALEKRRWPSSSKRWRGSASIHAASFTTPKSAPGSTRPWVILQARPRWYLTASIQTTSSPTRRRAPACAANWVFPRTRR